MGLPQIWRKDCKSWHFFPPFGKKKKKQTKPAHLKNRIQLSDLRSLSNFGAPLQPCTKQHEHCHAPNTLIPLPGAQTNFSCFQTLSLPEPAAAIEDIHPSAQDDYDWSDTKQSICFPSLFSPVFLPSLCRSLPPFVSFTSSSCNFVVVRTMMKKWECGLLWHRAMWE